MTALNPARVTRPDQDPWLTLAEIADELIGELLTPALDLREAASILRGQEDVFFSEEFLVERPILQALRADPTVVLLIDETLDWAQALVVLGAAELDREITEQTLSVIIKYDCDREKALRGLGLGQGGKSRTATAMATMLAAMILAVGGSAGRR